MKNIINKTTKIFALILINLFYFSSVAAQSIYFPNPINQNSLLELINAILRIVLQIGAILAVFFVIYSGFLFVTARGNPGKIEAAQKTFFYTIIGGLIILGAFVISEIIQSTVESFGVKVK